MNKYEDDVMKVVNENYEKKQAEKARVFEYTYVEEQPKKVVERHQASSGLKEKVAAIVLIVSMAAGGIAWNIWADKRTDKLMDTYDNYLEYTEMSGRPVNQDTYNDYIEHQDEYDEFVQQAQEARGGR